MYLELFRNAEKWFRNKALLSIDGETETPNDEMWGLMLNVDRLIL